MENEGGDDNSQDPTEEPTPEPTPEQTPEATEPTDPEVTEPTPEPTPEPDQGSGNEDEVEEPSLKVETKEENLDLQASLKDKVTENLTLTVERKNIKELVSDQYTFTEVFDINLITSAGKKVQPASTLTITLRPSTELEADTVLIHEIIENGVTRQEKLDYEITEDAKGKLITFDVNHLSLFGIGKVADKSEAGTNNSTETTSSTATSDISPESTEESQTTLETSAKLTEPTTTKDANDNKGTTVTNTQGTSANKIANSPKSTAQVPAVTGEKAAMPMIISFILLTISGAMLVFKARRED